MARTISRRVVPHGILRERRVFLSIGTMENLSKIVCYCLGEGTEWNDTGKIGKVT